MFRSSSKKKVMQDRQREILTEARPDDVDSQQQWSCVIILWGRKMLVYMKDCQQRFIQKPNLIEPCTNRFNPNSFGHQNQRLLYCPDCLSVKWSRWIILFFLRRNYDVPVLRWWYSISLTWQSCWCLQFIAFAFLSSHIQVWNAAFPN